MIGKVRRFEQTATSIEDRQLRDVVAEVGMLAGDVDRHPHALESPPGRAFEPRDLVIAACVPQVRQVLEQSDLDARVTASHTQRRVSKREVIGIRGEAVLTHRAPASVQVLGVQGTLHQTLEGNDRCAGYTPGDVGRIRPGGLRRLAR